MKTKLSPLLIGIATSVLLVGCQSPRDDTATQWEYKSSYNTVAMAASAFQTNNLGDAKVYIEKQREHINKQPDYVTTFLNDMAKQGWIFIQKDEQGIYTFKRPKK